MPKRADKTTIDTLTEETSKVSSVAEKKVATKKEKKNVTPLEDADEIEVVSLIPNISYLDNETMDMYKWESVGDTETINFSVIKKMWRNHKGYFNKLWLKPLDERVIEKFHLQKIYDKYDYLLEKKNYTKENVNKISEALEEVPKYLKFTIADKVKTLVTDGEISNIQVIKALEKKLNVDLFDLI